MKMRIRWSKKRECTGGAFIKPRRKKIVPVKSGG